MAESLQELLVHSGLVSEAGLAVARLDAERARRRLPETLIDLRLVDERRFAEWMAQVSRTALVDAIPEEEAAAMRHLVPAAVARDQQAVPLRLVEEQLFVVMVNALDGHAIDVLQGATGMTVRSMTGVRSDVERMVNHLYPVETDIGDATVLARPDEEPPPFDFSNETLLRRPPELDFLREAPPAEVEFGTMLSVPLPKSDDEDLGTQPPVPRAAAIGDERRLGEDSTAPTQPFVEIERRLDQIVRMIRRVEKRLDELEGMFRERGETLRR